MIINFLEKSCTECGGGTSGRPLFKKTKLSIFLGQQPFRPANVLKRNSNKQQPFLCNTRNFFYRSSSIDDVVLQKSRVTRQFGSKKTLSVKTVETHSF